MKTIYYDAFRSGLIPVKPICNASPLEVKVKVARTKGGYKAGEIIQVSRSSLVQKTRIINGHQYVTNAVINL